MERISSKIRFSNQDLNYLYNALNSGKLVDEVAEGVVESPKDVEMIGIALKRNIEKKIRKNQQSYLMDLNVFEILYIQLVLDQMLPYLSIKSALYENYLFEHRDELKQHEVTYLKETHSNVYSSVQSLAKLAGKLENLQKSYEKDYDRIASMTLEERIQTYTEICKRQQERPSNIISIHTTL